MLPGQQQAERHETGCSVGPGDVAELGGVLTINELRKDRQKAYFTYEAINEAGCGPFLATPDGEIYVYEDGVWKGEPHGIQRLRQFGHQALWDSYGENVLRELREQVRSLDVVPRERLGAPKRTVPVANGLYELEAGEVREYRPEDCVLSQLPVPYEEDAECPRWREFVQEVAEPGMADALQEYVGYTLLVNEWIFDRVLLLVGSGSNGKSTFLNVVTELLGPDNVTGFTIGDLAYNEYHVAEMFGAIANIDADVTGGIGHGGMFKKLTGGDKKVSARHPYGKPFSYAPTTKQLYSANQVPETKVDDTAFFRRWLIVEFPNEYTDADKPGPDKDPELEDRLIGEHPGILNWAIEGLERLLEQGHFTNEGETEDKRHRWQSWGDTVDKFISECVEVGGNEKYTSSETYDRYVAFCREILEETPESQRTLTDQLKKLPDIRYSGDFRFNGKKARGFKGLKFGWAPAKADEVEMYGQSTLPQADAYQLIIDTITDLEESESENPVSIDSIIDACGAEVGGSDRVAHIIGNLVNQKRLYRPEEGHVRTV